MLNYHRERFRKLTFRALALRQIQLARVNDENTVISTGISLSTGIILRGHVTM